MSNYEAVFTNIYENWGFGGDESRSGPGSTLDETRFIRKHICDIVKQINAKKIVDVPCGDFNWMKEVISTLKKDGHSVKYVGGDIVPEMIENNKKEYGSDKIKFKMIDLINGKIPKADLLIVRDVLGHMPLEFAEKAVENILKSECKYLLTTTWYNEYQDQSALPDNVNIDYFGRFYAVNLFKPPFNFSDPLRVVIENVQVDDFDVGNRKSLSLWKVDNIRRKKNKIIINSPFLKMGESKFTIVSGLWDIGRDNRKFEEFYLPRFKEFLQIPHPMTLFLPKSLHDVVWEIRDESNTRIVTYELENIKRLYAPHWDKTQEIRTSNKWLNITGENGWLKNSPQATLEWYNPIVQSKMFMLSDARLYNHFGTEYLYWLDAGITNTVPASHLINDDCLSSITDYTDPWLFLSYPYENAGEIHGFDSEAMDRMAGEKVKYVCRGGLFGGKKEMIAQANATYYGMLNGSLNQGYMGTEESIFTIMSYVSPHQYRRYMLDGNGLIVKFTQALLDKNVVLEDIPENIAKPSKLVTEDEIEAVNTNLYILTFNFPEQLLHLMQSLEKNQKFLTKTTKYIFDNSTKKKAKKKNKEIANDYGFEYIHNGDNIGITGGRQKIAEHFDESDADFMFFFEDDMTLNGPDKAGEFCRNGFRKHIDNLYDLAHKVIMRDSYDFVKLSFTEVFMDNQIQCSWYNVPQEIRKQRWPNYYRLPETGLDPNAPLTDFNNIRVVDSVSYIDGEIYYCNWPMIISKEGNKKMFIETKWAHPAEATLMSHIFQRTIKGEIKPAVLLASPVNHERLHHYEPEERREN